MITGENIKISIGEIEEEDEWEEKGPNAKPGLTSLRSWDEKLLARYKPKYNAVTKQCTLCAFGPCDFSAGRRGACGINLNTQLARENLLLSVIGASAHTSHARHGLNQLIKKHGKDAKLSVALNTEVEAPWVRLVYGIKPKTLGDLEKPLAYVEEQLTHLTSSVHTGQEASENDFHSKAFHAGMLDHLGMEIADITQISALSFPKGEPEPKLAAVGFSSVDTGKPVILCIGHNVATGVEIVDYAEENKKDVEIAGICCTALDIARYNPKAKVIGPLSYQLPYVRSGIADVIVLDEQCIRVDTIENAARLGIPVITTSDQNAGGLSDYSEKNVGEIVEALSTRNVRGCYITDSEKASEVAVKVAELVHKNKKIKKADITADTSKCTACGLCLQACPVKNDVRGMIRSVRARYLKLHDVDVTTKEGGDTLKAAVVTLLKENAYTPTELSDKLGVSRQYVYKVLEKLEDTKKAKKGKEVYYSLSEKAIKNIEEGGSDHKEEKPLSEEELMNYLERCIYCGRCETYCPQRIPIVSVFAGVYKHRFSQDKARMSPGRGAIQDTEIREVGQPIVFGEIPGVIAPVGCSFWPNGGRELGEMVEEFLKRNYIVTASGCAAMALATDYSGTNNLYEKYGGGFGGGQLVNVGSCVANAHITGAAIKIASIFARRKLRGNFEEIADYVLNRIGAVGLVWGTYSQKAVAIGNGAMRLGIPVIWGPSGRKYRKELLSDESSDFRVYDTKSEGLYDVGPVPEHLSVVADSKEQVMVLIPKLCMRASDGVKGRQIKVAHYIDVHKKYVGSLPQDLGRFIRNEKDVPLTLREEVKPFLESKGWRPVERIPDPTLLERLGGGRK
jgi:CO dehydrogenase/acetyl-CoA synthase alpha subunit